MNTKVIILWYTSNYCKAKVGLLKWKEWGLTLWWNNREVQEVCGSYKGFLL